MDAWNLMKEWFFLSVGEFLVLFSWVARICELTSFRVLKPWVSAMTSGGEKRVPLLMSQDWVNWETSWSRERKAVMGMVSRVFSSVSKRLAES